MTEVGLSAAQKDVVRRYVETWRRCRPGIRAFARLEDDMDSCRGVLADGIAVDNRPGGSVIVADDKDKDFYAAIFGNHHRCSGLSRLAVLCRQQRASMQKPGTGHGALGCYFVLANRGR